MDSGFSACYYVSGFVAIHSSLEGVVIFILHLRWWHINSFMIKIILGTHKVLNDVDQRIVPLSDRLVHILVIIVRFKRSARAAF